MDTSTAISIFMFLKELIFGKNNSSHDNKPFSSRARNWIIFIILLSSLSANYFLANKVFRLTVAYIALDKEKKKLVEQVKTTERCNIANDALQKLILTCKVN